MAGAASRAQSSSKLIASMEAGLVGIRHVAAEMAPLPLFAPLAAQTATCNPSSLIQHYEGIALQADNASVLAAIAAARESLRVAGGAFDELCCNVQDVLVDLAYEHGAKLASFSMLLKRVAQQYWTAAAAEGARSAQCAVAGGRCNENMARLRAGCEARDAWIDPPTWGAFRSSFDVSAARY
eukprot:2663035-Prymnesium_polylepis.1